MMAVQPLATPWAGWTLRLQVGADGAVIELAPGQTARGVRERGSVTLRAPTDDRWRLEIDDEIIEPDAGLTARWTWCPGFFAGEVVVRLVHVLSERATEYRIDVSPDPAKLGRDSFASMLKTLWTEAPELLVGEEPSRAPLGASQAHEDPLLVYGRLRRYGPSFLGALDAVVADPIERLRRERRRLPIHLIRRSDRRTALDLVRNGGLGEKRIETDFNSSKVELFDAPVVEPTLDNPANRAMLATLRLVLLHTRRCTRALERRTEKEQDSETRTSLQRRWPTRQAFLRRLEHGLRAFLLRGPLADLPRAELSPAGFNAVSAHPVYARAHKLGWLCTRRSFAGAATADELWMPPTWEVYERWCWVILRRQLEDEGFVACGPGGGLPKRHALWSGVDAKGTHATLLFQPRFPSWSTASQRRGRSLSSLLIPDIVLVIEGIESSRFEVFDAKYRTSRSSVLESMRSAHLYHDALRLDGRRPDRVVLLVPAGGGAPWLEDEGFLRKHGVGVRVLAPEGVKYESPRLVRRVLGEHQR